MIYLLSIHIISAIIMTITSVGLIAYAVRRVDNTSMQIAALSSFVATIGTGASLLFLPGTSLAHFCINMSVFTLFLALSQLYYRKRVEHAT